MISIESVLSWKRAPALSLKLEGFQEITTAERTGAGFLQRDLIYALQYQQNHDFLRRKPKLQRTPQAPKLRFRNRRHLQNVGRPIIGSQAMLQRRQVLAKQQSTDLRGKRRPASECRIWSGSTDPNG